MPNPFVHVELNTTDVSKAKAFYGKLFDWALQDADMGPGGTYTIIDVGGGTGGGMMKHPVPRCAVVVADLCSRRRHRRRNSKSQIVGRHRHEGCDRSDGRGMVEHHHRSDGRRAWTMEAKDDMKARFPYRRGTATGWALE